MQKGADSGVLHTGANDIMPRQERGGHHGGVTAVEDAHLLLFVGVMVGDKLHRQARLGGGELLRQGLRGLNDPQSEGFRRVQQGVGVAVLLVQLRRPLLGIAGNDAVHQRAAKAVFRLQPAPESLLQPPVGGVAEHILPQYDSVIRNELAGQQYPARRPGAPALPQQPGQLGGKRGGGPVVPSTGRVVDDACLSRVGDHKAQFRLAGGAQQLVPIRKHIQRPADTADHPPLLHYRAVLLSPQAELIEPLLGVDAPGLSRGGRRDYHHSSVKPRPFIHPVDEIVGKAPEEIPLAKLKHPLGRLPEDAAVPFLQDGIGQLSHRSKPLSHDSSVCDISVIYHTFRSSVCQSSFFCPVRPWAEPFPAPPRQGPAQQGPPVPGRSGRAKNRNVACFRRHSGNRNI